MLTKLEKSLAEKIHGLYPDLEDHLMRGGDPQLIAQMEQYLEYIGVYPIPAMPYLLCTTQDALTRVMESERQPLYDRLGQWYMDGNAAEMKATLDELGMSPPKGSTDLDIIHYTSVLLHSKGFNPTV